MKLADLSYREYIALEVLPSFAGHIADDEAAWRAFGVADAFLKRCGKEQNKIKEAEERAKLADLRCVVLSDQLSHVMSKSDGDFAASIALRSIWDFLGVTDQTAAMQMLRDAFPELGS